MPRVTFEMYCRQHLNLKNTWKYAQGNFAKIPYRDQRYLHSYFRPAENLSREQLRAHWEKMRKDPDSSHPHCAGRAYAALRPFLVNAPVKLVSVPVQPPKKGRRPDRVIRVEGLAQPEIDIEKFAKLLIEIAESEKNKKLPS